MNKKFTKLIAALALLVFMTPSMVGWGQTTVDVTLSSGAFSNNVITWTCADGNITIQQLKGSGSSNPNSSYISAPRVYKQNILSFVGADGYTITKIDIKYDGSYYGITKYAGTEITNNNVNNNTTALNATWSTAAAGTHTIETVSSDGLSEIYIQNGHSSDASSTQLRITKLTITYKIVGATFTVTYDCNGGETDCPTNVSDIESGTSITLAAAPTKPHYNFNGWKNGETTYNAGASYTVNSNVTFIAQWESDGTLGEGSICFSNQSGCTVINNTSVTGDDDLGNTWTITTEGTTSFTNTSTAYSQVGSGSSPATSITFTTTLDEEVNVTNFSATFGGFNATRASVVLKVDNTQVGTGTLNGSADVTVSSSSAQIGTTLTVIVTPTAGGVKCYNISYAYETIDNPAVATTTTISLPQNFNTDIYQGTNAGTLTATVTVTSDGSAVTGATVTWSSSNTGVATIDANGAVTLVAVGTTTITASYAGIDDQYRPSQATYTLEVTSSAPVVDYATLPFAYDGNALAANLVPGLTQNGITDSYNTTPKIKFDTQGDYVILKINERPGILTFNIKGNSFSGGTFKVQTSEDGQTYSDLKTYDDLTTTVQNESFNNLGADVRYIRWIYTEKISGNVALGKINLAAYVAPQPYDLTVSTLTNAEILVFDATSPNENDWVDLLDGSGTVSVAEGTPIALSVSAEQGYVLTELMVNGVNHVADIDGSGVYTFDMPTQDVTITVTAVQAYTIMFSVNDQELASAEMEVAQGSALGTLPTPTENIPVGFTFVGWMESPAHPYYNVTTAPTMVNAQTVPQDDMILDAVFCIAGTTTTTWTLSDAAPVHGEQVILAALDDSKYYAMNGPTGIEFTVSNNSITGNVPEAIFTANISLEGSYLIQGNNYLHFNSSALKLASGTTNGDITYTAKDGGFTLYANSRYMTYNSTSHGFGVSQMEDDAETMLVFKASTVTSDATDYTTLVTNHADQSTIAENAAETLYGIHYINGYVLAGAGVTNNGKLVIKANAQLDMDESSLTNATAANLIIEDGGQLIHNNAGVQATVQKNIAAHGATPADGGWYFISSPIMSSSSYDYGITPSAAGLITDNYGSSIPEGVTATYDLFKFDQSVDLEWRNYRNANFNLERSEGYLYANMNDVTLSFEGEIRSSDGNATTGLDNISGASLAGWNLKGNPFTCKAYSSLPYYVIDGAQLNTTAVVASTPIDVCTGIMVHGSNSMTFSRTQQVNAPNGNLQMTVAQQVVSRDGTSTGSTTIDNAIVSFNESDMLEKFVFNADLSKLYIPQDGKDYAIVASEGQGTLPVNFKATENGNYTITVSPEGVDLNYLHLIDNMTGNDVDLLQTPSYTFEASTRDYESRFRLVFASASTDASTDESFAYFNGSEWVIDNNGEATLQVVDVLGRIISTETINGNFNLNLNQKSGVYMLRLINGENVKVQKVVVR